MLKRYLLGNAGEKDINAVDNWYNSFERVEFAPLPKEEAAGTKQEIWEKVSAVIKSERKIRMLAWQWKAAAIFLIVAGAAGVLLLRNYRTGQNNTIAYTTMSTGIGERKEINIRDGSRLMLNAGTTIRIANDFSTDRKIELVDGEVFFDVKRDVNKPFVIQSQGLTTTVLGTAFTISAYEGLNHVSVGVVRGKVRVGTRSNVLSVLEKDEELVYYKNSKSYKKIPLDESLTAWREGRLMLNDLSFSEMATITKKNFGIDVVTNDDSVKNTRYTTELLSSMSPAQAAEVLAAIHNLKIRATGNTIVFYK